MKRGGPIARRTRLRPVNPSRKAKLYARNFGEWADVIRGLPCVTCGVGPPSDPSHTRTRGAGGDLKTIVPMCRACHQHFEEHPLELKKLRPVAAALWALGEKGGADRMTLEEMKGVAVDVGMDMKDAILVNGVWRKPQPPLDAFRVYFDNTYGNFSFPSITYSLAAPPSQETEPVLPVRQTTESPIGWRVWNDNNGTLESLTQSVMWEGPVMRADKKPHAGDPFVGDGRGHGIYSYKKAKAAFESHVDDVIVGMLRLSGTVVVHEHGYRSEIATVERLYVSPQTYRRGLLKQLADRYQCEVTTDWRKFARKEKHGHR